MDGPAQYEMYILKASPRNSLCTLCILNVFLDDIGSWVLRSLLPMNAVVRWLLNPATPSTNTDLSTCKSSCTRSTLGASTIERHIVLAKSDLSPAPKGAENDKTERDTNLAGGD